MIDTHCYFFTETTMLRTASNSVDGIEKWAVPAIQILCASILLALTSQIAIPLPFTPVPITLQTFAVFMIAMTLGSKKGTAAVLTYLAQGAMGLPVFAGGMANSMWFLGPRAGYLIGFVAAAWIIGRLVEAKRERSLFETLLILALGEVAILVPGALWLSFYVGAQNAISLGVVPFVAGDFIKMVSAAMALSPTKRLLNRFFG